MPTESDDRTLRERIILAMIGTQGMQQIDTTLMTGDAEKLLRYINEGPEKKS